MVTQDNTQVASLEIQYYVVARQIIPHSQALLAHESWKAGHDLGTRIVKLGFTVILVMRWVDLDKVVPYAPW